MAEIYTKSRIVDGEVILLRTDTREIPKKRKLEDLVDEEKRLQEQIIYHQAELLKVQTTIADITKITASGVKPIGG